MLITKEQYMINPCGALAIPYHKYISMPINNNISVVHDLDYNKKVHTSSNHQRFFRMIHNMVNIPNIELNGFSFVIVDIRKDIDVVVKIINKSYIDIKVSKDEILDLTKTKVFQNDLWIFVKDEKNNTYVGLGIAEYDHNCKELILEWIQVIPSYRNRGLGKSLVLKLLKTAKNETLFTTVSGDYNNITNPESLYRKCGFTGNDLWHVLFDKKN